MIEKGGYVRPALITEALESDSTVYYLGVGSNMLKEKVINRGTSTINLISFEAARVDNYRLAFNMKGNSDCRKLLYLK